MECTDGPESDNKRMKAFSRCFEPFVSHGPVRNLSEVADEGDKVVLTDTELESQFIADGDMSPPRMD